MKGSRWVDAIQSAKTLIDQIKTEIESVGGNLQKTQIVIIHYSKNAKIAWEDNLNTAIPNKAWLRRGFLTHIGSGITACLDEVNKVIDNKYYGAIFLYTDGKCASIKNEPLKGQMDAIEAKLDINRFRDCERSKLCINLMCDEHS